MAKKCVPQILPKVDSQYDKRMEFYLSCICPGHGQGIDTRCPVHGKTISLNNDMYEICRNGLRNKINGDIVPQDEPIFILRASDVHSAATIRGYQSHFRISEPEFDQCTEIIASFQKFQEVNDDEHNED